MNFFQFLDTVSDAMIEINKEQEKARKARARQEVLAQQDELLRRLLNPEPEALPVGTVPRLLASTWHSTDKVEILKRVGAQVPAEDFKTVLNSVMAGTSRLEAVRAMAHGGSLRRSALAAAAGECFFSASARREAILIALG